jgi:hypothetical protein
MLVQSSAFPYFNFDRISSEGTSSVAPACTLSGFTTAKPIIQVMIIDWTAPNASKTKGK